MTLVSLSNVRVDFGATTIVRDVTCTVARGERWGIVGRNGAGKTTLFRVITGEVVPVDGAIARLPGLKVALLDQQRDYGGAVTVWEAAAYGYRSDRARAFAPDPRRGAGATRRSRLGGGYRTLWARAGALRARRRLRIPREG